MRSHIESLPFGSRPVVGSSRKMTGGSAMRAAPRSSLRRMPPEYVFTVRSAASASSKCSMSFSARLRTVAASTR